MPRKQAPPNFDEMHRAGCLDWHRAMALTAHMFPPDPQPEEMSKRHWIKWFNKWYYWNLVYYNKGVDGVYWNGWEERLPLPPRRECGVPLPESLFRDLVPESRAEWIRQMNEDIAAQSQLHTCPDALRRLRSLFIQNVSDASSSSSMPQLISVSETLVPFPPPPSGSPPERKD